MHDDHGNKAGNTVFPLLLALKKDRNGFVFFLMAKNATLRASYLEVPLYLYINIKSFQSGQKPIEHAETVDSQWTDSGQSVETSVCYRGTDTELDHCQLWDCRAH